MPSESGISSALAFLVLRLEGARDEGTEDWGVATFEALRSVSFGTQCERVEFDGQHTGCLLG